MHPAPAVTVPCGDGGAWRVLKAALSALTAAALSLWSLAWLGWAAAGATLLAALVGAATAGLQWRRGPEAAALLCWNQQHWTLRRSAQAEATVGQVTVAFDLGAWLLLRFDAESGPTHWLPMSAHRLGAAAGALRGALYAGGGRGTAAEAAFGGPR